MKSKITKKSEIFFVILQATILMYFFVKKARISLPMSSGKIGSKLKKKIEKFTIKTSLKISKDSGLNQNDK